MAVKKTIPGTYLAIVNTDRPEAIAEAEAEAKAMNNRTDLEVDDHSGVFRLQWGRTEEENQQIRAKITELYAWIEDHDQLRQNFHKLPLGVALFLYLYRIRDKVKPATLRDYRATMKPIERYFALKYPERPFTTLEQVRLDDIVQYEPFRRSPEGRYRPTKNGRIGVGTSRILHELCTLSLLLKDAGLWHKFEGSWFVPPRISQEAPRGVCLSDEQIERLLEVSGSKPRWRLLHYYIRISLATTAGPSEILCLRLQDVNLTKRTIHTVLGAKNRERQRIIPLNDDAVEAIKAVVERAKSLGACQPEHFIFPHRAHERKAKPDVTKPMTTGGLRSAWKSVRKKAKLNVRLYDLRHTAITELLENPEIPERAVITLAGHVGKAMLKKYSHIRDKALRSAVDTLMPRKRVAVG